ncbi:malonate decarboxylase epsilon subunit [Paenibacillus tianmuensis]|uniref:Malonyl CoA-acyl carrier protein transacylase n=1 Tax=Paenibacillus tianmuensis TaxID=624147 RepID=A0A1G4PHE2_9BACL|nr:malonate decarboxylase subunit epsilon [Paenibacillus tianmuensis]SCW31733.1 malonate decarboxylase epsilon subunit [Paenibacillus tianmuensis]
MSVVFLFPGQGSQQTEMLHQLPDHPAIEATFHEASEVLKEDVYTLDSEKSLSSTIAVQLALLISGVAAARALQAEGASPDWVAGHSVGAFSAAVISNVLEFKDALQLVKLRATLMENAYPRGYGMGVVAGLHERRLFEIIQKEFTREEPVYMANLNAPQQITVAGAIAGLERVFASARLSGARMARLLNVSVPSHCPLLNRVSEELMVALERTALREPTVPYAANVNARTLKNAAAIRKDLALSVAKPVRWHDATTLLYERGARLFVEMSPGHVLTDLAAAAFPNARSISFSKSGLEDAKILILRESS